MSAEDNKDACAKDDACGKDGKEAQDAKANEAPKVNSASLYPNASNFFRVFALWYFATLMTVWNLLGHTVLGFEQSWAQYLTALFTAIFCQFLFEWVDAKQNGRPLRFAGGVANFLNFMPPAIIAGSACGMLLFCNERCWPYAFAAVVTIGSKILIRVPIKKDVYTHAVNPSNFGIVVTILAFPWIGVAPPYHFTNRIDMGDGTWNLLVPSAVLCSGIFLHGIFTGRLPLILSWICGFFTQAVVRSYINDAPLMPFLVPMTGASFTIFTLYMIPDPATTPIAKPGQIAFGLGCAAVYATLFQLHIVYGWFLALVIVAGLRFCGIWLKHWLTECS